MRYWPSAWVLILALPAGAADDAKEFFEMRIRPLLSRNCFTCHTDTKMGGLQLLSRESMLKGGNSGAAIVPGDPRRSLLIQAVSHTHERLKMPPTGKLTDPEIADLEAWVKMGAVWPEHAPGGKELLITPHHRAFWAFQPVRKPPVPAVRDRAWPKSAIDSFLLANMEAAGLRPVRPADKQTLIRRATYDLIGLPPTPEEVEAFLRDSSPNAFALVVDRLLASARYGERWGRHWLDVARYSDDKLNSTQEEPYPNAFRYRDWVIEAFNQDLPYDQFIKAQIAGDLLPSPERYVAGLGFYALRPEFQDDRVDATTRGFLGLTVACAQCHDHKYDPIPTRDYYSLLGVFTSSENHEYPLATPEVVAGYKARKKKIEDQEKAIKDFIEAQSAQLGEILAAKTTRYLLAAARGTGRQGLDSETLERFERYLKGSPKEHPFLKDFEDLVARGAGEEDLNKTAEAVQRQALAALAEKKAVEEKNLIRLGGNKDRRTLSDANLVSMERDRYFLWRDLFSEQRFNLSFRFDGGLFYYGDKKIDRFLHGEWKAHLETMRAELESLRRALPRQYPFLQIIKDSDKPANQRVHLRGNRENLGEEAPRRFLSILSDGPPAAFSKGSGRLELAEAIADPRNPLTARVMVNRTWQGHFGAGIVRTAGNFGTLGERPSHPELLDYLAARFIEQNWSIKALHREIMLSAAYALSAEFSARHAAVDADNRLFWRANRRRLDAEELRDSLLFVAGNLDSSRGGAPARLTDDNRRRAVYGYVSRRKLDPLLALFDFPNPNSTSERRRATNVPLQALFLLNSSLVLQQAEVLACRLADDAGAGDEAKIRRAYRLLFGRQPTAAELRLGVDFARSGPQAWPRYAQVLLSSNEFLYVN